MKVVTQANPVTGTFTRTSVIRVTIMGEEDLPKIMFVLPPYQLNNIAKTRLIMLQQVEDYIKRKCNDGLNVSKPLTRNKIFEKYGYENNIRNRVLFGQVMHVLHAFGLVDRVRKGPYKHRYLIPPKACRKIRELGADDEFAIIYFTMRGRIPKQIREELRRENHDSGNY